MTHARRRSLTAVLLAFSMIGACSPDDDESTAESTATSAAATSSTTTPPVAVTTVSGELTWTESSDGVRTKRFRFELAADGSYRLQETGGGNADWAYDASARRAMSVDDELNHLNTRRAAPGEPDDPPSPPMLERAVAEVVVATAASGTATKDTVLGRPAWKHRESHAPNQLAGETKPTDVEAWVDEQTHLPLRVTRRRGGQLVSDLEVKQLAVNPTIDGARFRVKPSNDAASDYDQGWEKSNAADARRIAGFVPFAPSSPPAGYGAPEVTLARRAQPTGPEAANPGERPAVAFTYRRGIDAVNVTTRPTVDQERWSSPFGTEGSAAKEEKRRLRAGSLSGADAVINVALPFAPYLFVIMPDRVFTISGPLSADQLVAVAESLQPAA